jgi:hypothetical protein
MSPEAQKAVDTLRTLHDEIRLKIHLADMDLRATWTRIEPEVRGAEQAARVLADETFLKALNATIARLTDLRTKLNANEPNGARVSQR